MEKTIEIIDRLSELDRKNEGYFKHWIEENERLEKLLKNKEDDEDADEQ